MHMVSETGTALARQVDDMASRTFPLEGDVACTDWWGLQKGVIPIPRREDTRPVGVAFFKHVILLACPIRYMWNFAIAFLASRTLKSIFYCIA
jgi:hypothetical protein